MVLKRNKPASAPTINPSARRESNETRRPASPSGTPSFALGVLVATARKVLFIDARKVALFYISLVVVLAFVERFLSLDNSYYIVQKHSVLNKYGVKLGWFWTLIIVGPFVWYSSKAHYRRDRDQPIIDLSRLGVATAFWYFSVQLFHKVTSVTSYCDRGLRLTRNECYERDGVWTPGIDISGHCFLMIYSILIMAEEANSFRNYKQISDAIPVDDEVSRTIHEKRTRILQYFFVAMLFLHVLWFKQLVISVLYYHIFYEEIFGALWAVFCWFITYRLLYPLGFLQSPIKRKATVK